MIHKNLLSCLGVLVACMAMGVLSQEPSSPWQAINPALSIGSSQEEYSETSYEVEYPEGQNNTNYEEDELYDILPFKLPFRMDKKQTDLALKLLKKAVKPLIKSDRLFALVTYLDDNLRNYNSDIETQKYVQLVIDSLQEIYEGKETTELNMILKRLFTDMSDERTARTLGGLWSSYVAPTLTNYVYDPVRNFIVYPVSEYFSGLARRVDNLLRSNRSPVAFQYTTVDSRWGDMINTFAKRISDYTAQARQGLVMANQLLEHQEEGARGCYDCGEHHEDSQEAFAVQVHDVSFLGWLLGGLGIILGVAALSSIAPAVAIPVALGVGLGAGGGGGGGGGGDFTGPTGFDYIEVPVIPAQPQVVAPVIVAPTGPQATAPVFAPAAGVPVFGGGGGGGAIGGAPSVGAPVFGGGGGPVGGAPSVGAPLGAAPAFGGGGGGPIGGAPSVGNPLGAAPIAGAPSFGVPFGAAPAAAGAAGAGPSLNGAPLAGGPGFGAGFRGTPGNGFDAINSVGPATNGFGAANLFGPATNGFGAANSIGPAATNGFGTINPGFQVGSPDAQLFANGGRRHSNSSHRRKTEGFYSSNVDSKHEVKFGDDDSYTYYVKSKK